MNVFESIGFSGTTRLSNSIGEIPGSTSCHGSRNFDLRLPIGNSDTSPSSFTDQMVKCREKFEYVTAVHCLFDPKVMASCCEERGIQYIALLRNPLNQIRSCYYWILQEFLIARRTYLLPLPDQERLIKWLQAKKIESSLQNVLYIWSAERVLAYQLNLFEIAPTCMKIEEITEQKNIDFIAPKHQELFLRRFQQSFKNSHATKTKTLDKIIGSPNLKAINDNIVLSTAGNRYDLPSIMQRFNYEY